MLTGPLELREAELSGSSAHPTAIRKPQKKTINDGLSHTLQTRAWVECSPRTKIE
jgi:hypothetical protein